MTKEEILFHEIAVRLPNISKGKVFGAMGILNQEIHFELNELMK